MARLIDADAYADELKRREKLCFYQIDNADVNATVSEVEYWSGVIGTFNEAMCVLADAPTVGGWVSVKDRMPEKNGRYLCRYEQEIDGKVCRCTDFGMFDSNIGDKGGWFCEKVTHWMPLPTPPEVSK